MGTEVMHLVGCSGPGLISPPGASTQATDKIPRLAALSCHSGAQADESTVLGEQVELAWAKVEDKSP